MPDAAIGTSAHVPASTYHNISAPLFPPNPHRTLSGCCCRSITRARGHAACTDHAMAGRQTTALGDGGGGGIRSEAEAEAGEIELAGTTRATVWTGGGLLRCVSQSPRRCRLDRPRRSSPPTPETRRSLRAVPGRGPRSVSFCPCKHPACNRCSPTASATCASSHLNTR